MTWWHKKKPPKAPEKAPRTFSGVAYTTGIVERLTPEKSYRFIHRRKKTFVARYLGRKEDDDGDTVLHVLIDTSVGSGAEHLANAVIYRDNQKLQPNEAEKWVKAKFIQSIEEVVCLH